MAAHLQKAPHEVRLKLNERLQKEVFNIRVFDQKKDGILVNSSLFLCN